MIVQLLPLEPISERISKISERISNQTAGEKEGDALS